MWEKFSTTPYCILICKNIIGILKIQHFKGIFLCVYKTSTGMLFLSLSQCRCIFRGHALLASIFTQPHRIFITILGVEHIGPDHVQLTLLDCDTESVLALNKKLKVNWKVQFHLVPKNFRYPNWVNSIAHDPALSMS